MKKLKIKLLGFEVTRKCNIICNHCIRGKAQNVDMTTKIVDDIFDNDTYQISEIEFLSFTGGEPTLNSEIVTYIIDKIIEKNISITKCVNFITNGLIYNDDIINSFYKLQEYFNENNFTTIINYEISNDQFHSKISDELKEKYLSIPFVNKNIINNVILKPEQIINEGSALTNRLGAKKEIVKSDEIKIVEEQTSTIIDNIIYIGANGNVHTECMFSYDHFDKYAYGNVSNNNLIEIFKKIK